MWVAMFLFFFVCAWYSGCGFGAQDFGKMVFGGGWPFQGIFRGSQKEELNKSMPRGSEPPF